MANITQILFVAYYYHALVIEEREMPWGYRTCGFVLKTPQEMNACLRLRNMSYSNINIDLQTYDMKLCICRLLKTRPCVSFKEETLSWPSEKLCKLH